MTSADPSMRLFRGSAPFGVLLLFVCAALQGCGGSAPALVRLEGETMGTTWHVSIAQSVEDVQAIEAGIAELLADVNRKMSTYDPDSELSRFNKHLKPEPFSLSRETLEVMAIAQQVSKESGGAFDMTVGPIVNAYGFGPDAHSTPPTDEELDAMRAYVGYNHVSLDTDGSTATKNDVRVYCDLSAVAKGYGSDVVGRYLESQSNSNYMVEIGGEVRTMGHKPDGSPWTIGIEQPGTVPQAVQLPVPMRKDGAPQALATSGDYRNFFMEAGKRISHTIDGRTGRPIEHMLASASVLHESCAWADAYATAMMALGPEEGMAMAERLGLAVYLLVRTEDGAFEPRSSSQWPANK